MAAKIENKRKRRELLGPLGAILGPSWGPLGAVLALGSPSWGVMGRLGALLSRLKIDVKIDQKIDAFQDRFLERFWWILGRKMEACWHQNRIEHRALRKCAKSHLELGFRGKKLEVEIDENSIKKWSQDGKASWHRLLKDFGGFLEASWEGKWSQDRSKKASKKRWKSG